MEYKLYLLFYKLGNSYISENINPIIEKGNVLENWYYIIQIVSGIFVIFGTVIAVGQYLLACNDSKKTREREVSLHEIEVAELEKDRIQKAIDLAGFFKDNIITKTHILTQVYEAIGITDILHKINFQNITYFDKQELEDVINQQDRDRIKKVTMDPKFIQALLKSSDMTGLWEECTNKIEIQKEDGTVERIVQVQAMAIIYRFKFMLTEVLNDLEFFSMHFHHKTADESVVYQSLHKSYISVVQLLYYDISSNNINGEEKLFTNVIALYNEWYPRSRERSENEKAMTRESILHGSVVRNIDK